MLKGRNLGSLFARDARKERDAELGVDEGIVDPDIPVASIETDEETCSPGINIGPGKEDTMELGEMLLDPDIPIPSIELDGDEHMEEEEESEGRLVELQNGKDERHVIEEESIDILEARARDSHGTRCQDRTKLGRNRQHLLTTSRGQICLREAVPFINIT
ncbi:hypothetical protein BHYA_0027g00090 [Botrytis hyacinthi]|uniref:Uncharacterized protein n=1 Tax=Botrytis hyacinthi TaxID=278943 RepID=A0A4Z1H787_9HELO|nr:hypothetical protein BHYA_0027g00090 [Botrytis hyacinthi]